MAGETTEADSGEGAVIEAALDVLDAVEPGDLVRVHIENGAPIGPDTEFEAFEVKTVTEQGFSGTDHNWGTSASVDVDGDSLWLQAPGKSGEVVKIERMETTEDGVPIAPPDETVFLGEPA